MASKSASSVVRSNLERGNGPVPKVSRGQTAAKPGKARAGKPGTAKAVVMPNKSGTSVPTSRPWHR